MTIDNPTAPPGFHLPFPGFIHFGHFMPQADINVLHMLASRLWSAAGRPLIIAEVGSFTGASALALANYASTLVCIDTWHCGDDPDDRINAIYRENRDGAVLDAFRANTRHVAGTVMRLRTTSAAAAVLLKERGVSFDLVFLDGAHDFENVCDDIRAYLPLVRPGKILCGHDYGDLFPGVKQAVHQAFPPPRTVQVAGTVWWREVAP